MLFQKNLFSKKYLSIEKRILAAIHRGRGFVFFVFMLVLISMVRGKAGHAEVVIDMAKIAQIESSGDPRAVGRAGDLGLYQITPVLLKEYNAFCIGETVKSKDLFDAKKSHKVASWYFKKRIPQMLRHFKRPVTVRNVLIAWNAGIKYTLKGMKVPVVTLKYLTKYGAR